MSQFLKKILQLIVTLNDPELNKVVKRELIHHAKRLKTYFSHFSHNPEEQLKHINPFLRWVLNSKKPPSK
jgi:hypothetical protein